MTKTQKADAAKKTCAKRGPVKKVLKPVASRKNIPPTVDDNLKKLAASRLPANFVKAHDGAWDHAGWLEFLDILKEKGYDPIDPDRAGLILEDAKAKYLAKKK